MSGSIADSGRKLPLLLTQLSNQLDTVSRRVKGLQQQAFFEYEPVAEVVRELDACMGASSVSLRQLQDFVRYNDDDIPMWKAAQEQEAAAVRKADEAKRAATEQAQQRESAADKLLIAQLLEVINARGLPVPPGVAAFAAGGVPGFGAALPAPPADLMGVASSAAAAGPALAGALVPSATPPASAAAVAAGVRGGDRVQGGRASATSSGSEGCSGSSDKQQGAACNGEDDELAKALNEAWGGKK